MSAEAPAAMTMDPSKLPAVPPPPGVVPNFNNPDNYKHHNIVLHTVVLTITSVAVLVRLYTRAIIKKKFGVDDCEFCSGLCTLSELIF
jgi:hypothetical protein